MERDQDTRSGHAINRVSTKFKRIVGVGNAMPFEITAYCQQYFKFLAATIKALPKSADFVKYQNTTLYSTKAICYHPKRKIARYRLPEDVR